MANRLRVHARQGFDHKAGRWPSVLGANATSVATAIKAEVRALGANLQASKDFRRYRGHTETTSLDEVAVTDLFGIIELLIATNPHMPILSRFVTSLHMHDLNSHHQVTL
ncbi:hypothetical protein K1Y78_42370 [Streptomyces sp. tea 10]|nr:hypothetical protein [Streptomyces sp. tea 10]